MYTDLIKIYNTRTLCSSRRPDSYLHRQSRGAKLSNCSPIQSWHSTRSRWTRAKPGRFRTAWRLRLWNGWSVMGWFVGNSITRHISRRVGSEGEDFERWIQYSFLRENPETTGQKEIGSKCMGFHRFNFRSPFWDGLRDQFDFAIMLPRCFVAVNRFDYFVKNGQMQSPSQWS